jgi:hypothetical protein
MERDRETSPKLNLCVCDPRTAYGNLRGRNKPHTFSTPSLSLCRLVSFFSYVYSRRSILSLSPVLYQTAPAVDMLDNQPGGGLDQTI